MILPSLKTVFNQFDHRFLEPIKVVTGWILTIVTNWNSKHIWLKIGKVDM